MNSSKSDIDSVWYFQKSIKSIISAFVAILIVFVTGFICFVTLTDSSKTLSDLGTLLSSSLGVIIAMLVAVVTFLAFFVQYVANERFQQQFKIQQSSDHFYKMLDIHINNVKEFQINSFHRETVNTGLINIFDGSKSLFKGVEPDKIVEYFQNQSAGKLKSGNIRIEPDKIKKQEKSIVRGKRCFILMQKDLHFVIHYSAIFNDELTSDIKLSSERLLLVAYRIFFWGIDSQHIYPPNINKPSIKFISEKLKLLQKKIRNDKGNLYKYNYQTGKNKTKEIKLRMIPCSGHSSRLAHYYRHLYQTVKNIHHSYNDNKKYSNIEDAPTHRDLRLAALRAQLSNEEQLLLYYNYRIGFGANWDKRGRNSFAFLSEYKMIHNIPLYDTIHYLVENPLEHFREFVERKKLENPEYRLFEWEI